MSTAVERFWAKVKKTPTCWPWTACQNSSGYGVLRVDGKLVLAHRFAYELLVGPIPEGLELDHVKERGCRHRHCVNPAHLEPVTRQVNQLRSDSPSGRNSVKTHCPQGHPYSGENLYIDGGARRCRTCSRVRGNARSKRIRAEERAQRAASRAA